MDSRGERANITSGRGQLWGPAPKSMMATMVPKYVAVKYLGSVIVAIGKENGHLSLHFM